MNGDEMADRPVVPAKSPNKDDGSNSTAEGMEERGLTKENPREQNRSWTQCQTNLPNAIERIHQAALRDKEVRFTALFHHVYNVEHLMRAFEGLNPKATPGIDGETWAHYEENLEGNLLALSARLKRGAYRTLPVRRAYIPKPDGGQRPLGIPALEDKLVQRAMAEVLNAIYEADFLGFSYGFRPGRSAHGAMDALHVGLMTRKVNWVLDADIRGFFDAIDHGWLVKFLEHRIADQRVLRLIRKWLKAGVLEDGTLSISEYGSPQGASISPVLANVYLHYVFDLWVHLWRRKRAAGDVIVVRYADDYIVGFQYRNEAVAFLEDLRKRLAKFGLELHPDKTRLIEFGRFAIRDRRRRGEGKPETLEFLGFKHICSTSRKGGFVIRRRTIAKRLNRKLKEVKEKLRHRMHWPVPIVGAWLRAVIQGYFNYHAVPFNSSALTTFRRRLARHWWHVLNRRSQNGHVTWERMNRLVDRWFPPARVRHLPPWERFRCYHPR